MPILENNIVQRLIAPIGQCLSPEVARRIAELKADLQLQSRVDQLADKANDGTISDKERAEYEQYVKFSQFVTLLQIHARNLLDANGGVA